MNIFSIITLFAVLYIIIRSIFNHIDKKKNTPKDTENNQKHYQNSYKQGYHLPKHIEDIIDFFELEYPINQEMLKNKYRKLIAEYHPDKVSNLGKDLKELAEKKSKEIIDKYNTLNKWLKENEKK
jgi:hypothetical protein